MEPTMGAVSNYLVSDFHYAIFKPQRGDLIVFKSVFPENEYISHISRIVGLPSEVIEIRESGVYINNSLLEEPYLPAGEVTYSGSFLQINQSQVIPQNKYMVMGDRRNRSSDSREWGFLPKENIRGKVIYFRKIQ